MGQKKRKRNLEIWGGKRNKERGRGRGGNGPIGDPVRRPDWFSERERCEDGRVKRKKVVPRG